ncbi:MAG: hypothetical protein ACOX02_00550 [Acholeplasmatales bacterium]
MIILVGASASGKTEIAKILYKNGYKKCITTTTRQIRLGEIDGIDYHFITKEVFNKLLLENAFLEVTQYQNNLYGLQKKDIISDGVAILDPNGANNVITAMKTDVFVTFIKSSKKKRKERMIKRKDTIESIKNRLKNDNKTFKTKNLVKVDLIINNKDEPLEEIAKKIDDKYKKFAKKKTENAHI